MNIFLVNLKVNFFFQFGMHFFYTILTIKSINSSKINLENGCFLVPDRFTILVNKNATLEKEN